MAITPQDIQSKQFHVRFRGFDIDEVDSYLEEVAQTLLELVQENKKLRDKISTLSNDVDQYHTQEKSFQKAILSAQEIVDEMTTKSKEKAEQLINLTREETEELKRSTTEEVERMKEKAAQEKSDLNGEIENLKAMKGQSKAELRATLEDYLVKLEQTFTAPRGTVKEEVTEPESTPPLPSTEKDQEDPVQLQEDPVPLDDVHELYQKIDLPDSLDEQPPVEKLEPENTEPESIDLPEPLIDDPSALTLIDDKPEVETELDNSLPDLDGDIMFSLEDPLEEPEPEVTFNDKEDSDEFKI
jgi:cell division initiation protein